MSNRPFVMLAVAGASISALPAMASAQDYALPQLEPMPAASQTAPIAQSAQAAQLPPVYRTSSAQATMRSPVLAPVLAPTEAPVQAMHDRHRDTGYGQSGGHHDSQNGGHHGSNGDHSAPQRKFAYTQEQRDWWISECQRRMSFNYGGYETRGRDNRDNGLGGAAIGGVLGGIAGNRIGGRGNRTTGTVVGAAAGAVLGAVIDRAEDSGSRRGDSRFAGDDGGYCENYLAAYESGAFGYGHQGYAVAYAQPMIQRSMGHDHGHHKGHTKNCKKIVTTKEHWEEVPHEVVEEVRYVKQPTKRVRYVKQPSRKVQYTKQPARRSVKSVKSRK